MSRATPCAICFQTAGNRPSEPGHPAEIADRFTERALPDAYESVRLLVFKSTDGIADSNTNLGNGVNAAKYTLKRRLALADGGMQRGGLSREPDDLPVYRVLFENETARDWGSRGRYFQLAADCRSCHSGSGQAGVQMIGSVVNQNAGGRELQRVTVRFK